MTEIRTTRNLKDVHKFLQSVNGEQKLRDCLLNMEMMFEITGAKPVMWGEGIVGFGSFKYKYESGREGVWFKTGFAPRKQNITLHHVGPPQK